MPQIAPLSWFFIPFFMFFFLFLLFVSFWWMNKKFYSFSFFGNWESEVMVWKW